MVIGGQYNSFSGNSYKMKSQGMLNILMWREYTISRKVIKGSITETISRKVIKGSITETISR
jgi:hypothetical protein